MKRHNGMMIVFVLLMGASFVSCPVAGAKPDKKKEPDKAFRQREFQGRVDSVRPDKIVITYEPEDQPGVTLQTYFLRDEATQFLKCDEGSLKPGDVVAVAFEEASWKDEEDKNRVERTARSVRFIYTREIAELKKEVQALELVSFRRGDEEGPQ